MKNYRNTATIVGLLYILGTVGGVLSLVIAGNLVTGEDVLARIAADPSRLNLSTFFILVMGFSLAAMAVFLYPVLRKDSEALALGMLVFRGPLEGSTYILSALSWRLLVPLSNEFVTAGSDSAALQGVGNLLIQFHDYFGPIATFVFIIGATFLYTVFYRTKLIPRWLSGWGLVGAVIYVAVDLLKFFGIDPGLEMLYIPLAVQEMVMALWLVIKGFNTKQLELLEERS